MSQLEHLLQQCTVKLTLPGRSGWGTGFFVAPGWILTCAHVVKEAKGEPVQVRWQNQENWAQAVVERSLADSYDLALLRVTLPIDAKPPCVYLDEEIRSRDPLYLFGYPDQDFPNGCPVTFNCEGLTGDEPALIKFALGQVRPGMSGSPLLNQRTGKVCGIVKFTRDRSFDLGGGAIPSHVILEQFPQLQALQREFHGGDQRWHDSKEGQLFDIKTSRIARHEDILVSTVAIVPKPSLDNFCGLINWIHKQSKALGIRNLELYRRDELTLAIDRAKKGELDFRNIEIEVMELVVYYNFFYLESLPSPAFRKLPKNKSEYYSRLRKLTHYGQKIRANPIRLSSLINEDKMSKIVAKTEENDS